MLLYSTKLKKYSRALRNEMTEAEKLLWSKLRRKQLKGFQFYRQRIIGDFIVDFYCPKASLVIELDGGQHFSDEGIRKDKIRDLHLKRNGLKVLRYSDKDIFTNIEGILEEIYGNL